MIWLNDVSAVILTILVLTVAIFDVRQRRIPNFLVFPASLIGLTIYSMSGGLNGFFFSLKGLGLGFGLLLIPYLMKGMKAGDVKFAMAVGAFTGAAGIARVMLITFLCYPLMAAVVVVKEGKLGITWLRFRRIFFNFLGFFVPSLKLYGMRLESQDDETIASATTPFGVAITAGALISIYTGFLNSLF